MERAIFAGGCFWCMVKPFIFYSNDRQKEIAEQPKKDLQSS